MVFKIQNKTSFIKYALLCIIQMFISGLTVEYLSFIFGGASVIALKLLVDIILFVVNFVVQRKFIFIGEKK